MTNQRKHCCAAVDCNTSIALNLLMCRTHWFMVSEMTRDRIWKTYQRGQEIAGGPEPSEEYFTAMRQAVQEVATQEGKTVPGRNHA